MARGGIRGAVYGPRDKPSVTARAAIASSLAPPIGAHLHEPWHAISRTELRTPTGAVSAPEAASARSSSDVRPISSLRRRPPPPVGPAPAGGRGDSRPIHTHGSVACCTASPSARTSRSRPHVRGLKRLAARPTSEGFDRWAKRVDRHQCRPGADAIPQDTDVRSGGEGCGSTRRDLAQVACFSRP